MKLSFCIYFLKLLHWSFIAIKKLLWNNVGLSIWTYRASKFILQQQNKLRETLPMIHREISKLKKKYTYIHNKKKTISLYNSVLPQIESFFIIHLCIFVFIQSVEILNFVNKVFFVNIEYLISRTYIQLHIFVVVFAKNISIDSFGRSAIISQHFLDCNALDMKAVFISHF